MTSAEKKPNLTSRSSRILLAGLALVGSLVIPPQNADAAPGDGLRVCVVNKSPNRTIFNPDPLDFCPPYGGYERISSGRDTIDYMRINYPNGLGDSWILDIIKRFSH
jgi:hypothetical protein